EIEKKFKRAVTDSGSEVRAEEQSAGVRNLIQIQASFLDEAYETVLARYVGRQYGFLKVETAQVAIEKIRPIRENCEKILNDREYLNAVLQKGRVSALLRAEKVLNEVYKRIGFIGQ
ncbi:tryptophan--tRNA ligase, partial [bacterium]|nr:tryptophan--tRNA ligase [bacterium]